ncbi:MAG: alpha/beta hydrolase [Ideonella sp.]|jgi:pimeloyl-ACP methyl ester carboxylesterase|nr:alpha/beta hydrolase [Ideonella sp.]
MPTALPAALSGERVEFDSVAGRLSVYVAGQGPPLLLVHSINAAASAAEVAPLHDRYRASRTVFSVDLPGYGFSERRDRAYTPRLMTDALLALRPLVRDRCGPAPIDALALSLSCEFLARAAVESPADWRTLALVSPTGFNGLAERRGAPGSTRAVPGLLSMLRGPGWGGALFRGLTRPGVIRYFLERTWGAKQIDEALWRYDVLTTRQPGAEYAPLYFLSGALFSADIHDVYTALRQPVWMSQGVRGDFTDYRGRRVVEGRPNWRFTTYPTGALPHFEVPEVFTKEYDAFLANAPAASV